LIGQPVFAAMHLKNRTAPLQKRLVQLIQRRLSGTGSAG
jgi:hypothetical protein